MHAAGLVLLFLMLREFGSAGLRHWQTRQVDVVQFDRRQSRQARRLASELALLVARLHRHATVRPGWINRTELVLPEKSTRLAPGQMNCLPVVADGVDHAFHALTGVMAIGVNESRLAQDIKVVGLDDQVPLTAGPAAVALVNVHAAILAHLTGDAQINRWAATLQRRRRCRPKSDCGTVLRWVI